MGTHFSFYQSNDSDLSVITQFSATKQERPWPFEPKEWKISPNLPDIILL